MVHLRLIAPPELVDAALERLRSTPSVISIVHIPEVSMHPAGDLILCDVAREDASVVVAELRDLGLLDRGSVAVDTVDTVLGDAARRAELAAKGSPADAVVWEGVTRTTSESAELSATFAAFMVLATLIAACGILTDSQILLIGAMIVGPEFGPLAALSVGVVQRRPELARRALTALAVGFPCAMLAAYAGTVALRAVDLAPVDIAQAPRSTTLFISHPNWWSVIVAVLAGIAGTLSLTTAKSGALIGVLISVTTIPAAANVGVAAAYGDQGQAGGALAQLAINLASLALSGTATLALQRRLYERRRARLDDRRRRRAGRHA